MGSESRHVCHILGMAVFVMSDLELPIRGRTYREPEGPHSVVVRGRDLEAGLQHAAARSDCRAMAIVGMPKEDRDLGVLAGRRLFLVDSDGARLRDFAEIALRAEADVEWIRDRKRTRLKSSHGSKSYGVFCLKNKRQVNELVQVE